jgi:hypothetical protein
MPKNILAYNGTLTQSTSTTTIYTCPTLTVAEVRVDINFYRQSDGYWYILINGGDTTPSNTNFNYALYINSSTTARNNSIIYMNDRHSIGRQTISSTVAGSNTTSDHPTAYSTDLLETANYSSSTSVNPRLVAPKLYMTPGDKIKINSDANNSNQLWYNFTIIEEASTLT